MEFPWSSLPPNGWWKFVIRPFARLGLSFTLIFGGSFLLLTGAVYPFFLNKQTTNTVSPLGGILGAAFSSPSPLSNIPLSSQDAPEVLTRSLKISTETSSSVPSEFFLSVPSLGIENAVVETNATNPNPDFRLGHFRGTSLPGLVGSSFIYGHSALPFFFNPADYKTIFSTLPSLKEGDSFYIRIGEISYRYQVVKTEVLPPSEVDPLKDWGPEIGSSSSVVLMTCYPPGLSSKRFLAVGKLIF